MEYEQCASQNIRRVYKKNPVPGTDRLEDDLRSHPLPEYTKNMPTGNLTLPLVFPSRRLRDRFREFIRAYAPELDDSGIDQATWPNFFDKFHKYSVLVSPHRSVASVSFSAVGAEALAR